MRNTNQKIAAIMLLGICADSASAATSFNSEGHLSLKVLGVSDASGNYYTFGSMPGDISLSYADNTDDMDFDTIIIGDASAYSDSTPSSNFGQIDLYTNISGDAYAPYALATSDSTASGSIEFENTSSAIDYTVELLLSYIFQNEVETSHPAPANNQLAYTSIDMNVAGDFSLGQVLDLTEETELGYANYNASAKSKEIQLSFLLAAGEVENVFASLVSHGESESISAVPVPAAIFYFGPALLTLMIRRKKSV